MSWSRGNMEARSSFACSGRTAVLPLGLVPIMPGGSMVGVLQGVLPAQSSGPKKAVHPGQAPGSKASRILTFLDYPKGQGSSRKGLLKIHQETRKREVEPKLHPTGCMEGRWGGCVHTQTYTCTCAQRNALSRAPPRGPSLLGKPWVCTDLPTLSHLGPLGPGVFLGTRA